MLQPFFGRVSQGYASVAATSYMSLLASASALAAVLTDVECAMPFAGILSNVTVVRGTAPGVGSSTTWTLQKNNVDTALTFTFNAGETTASSAAGVSVSFVASDLLKWKITLTGSSAGGVTSAIAILINTADDRTCMFFNAGIPITSVTPGWIAPIGCQDRTTAAATTRTSCIAVAGNITGYRCYQSGSGTTGVGQDFAIFKNGVKQDGSGGTVDTRMTVSTTTVTGQSAVTFSLPVSPGDLIYLQTDRNGSASSKAWSYGMTFQPTNAGEIPFSASTQALATSGTQYSGYQVYDAVALTGSEVVGTMPAAIQLDNLYCVLTAAPSAGHSRVMTVRKTAGDTNLAVTIADAATTGNDTSHKIKYNAGDTFSYREAPAGSGTTAANLHSGMRMIVNTPKGAGGGSSGKKGGGGGGVSVLQSGGTSLLSTNASVGISSIG